MRSRHRETMLNHSPICSVDELVELHEALRPVGVSIGEGIKGDPDHLCGPLAHLVEPLDQCRIGLDIGHELRQLGHGDAVVGHPLEMEVDVEDSEDEPEIDRDRRLAR